MSAVISREKFSELSEVEKQLFTKEMYCKPSYFQQLFNKDQIELSCKEQTLAFRHQILRLLLKKNLIEAPVKLEELHNYMSDEMRAYGFDDGVNKLSTYFYETDSEFLNCYYQFIGYLREFHFKEPFWFQAVPTIRLHCPNGINSHHYPRYHTDIGYGHPPEEINLWIPLTEILEGHGFKIMKVGESNEILNSCDYKFSTLIQRAINEKTFTTTCEQFSKDVTTQMGSLLAFDSRCIHSGEPLKNHTRISMDIRILPLSQYEKMQFEYQGSGRRKILFSPGNCYHSHDSDYFLKKD